MGSAFLALMAGMLSTVSPCILPILPIVLVGALNTHRYGPLALVAGLTLTFTSVGLLLSGAIRAFDISEDTIRLVSAGLLLLFGIVLLSAALRARFAFVASPISARLNEALAGFAPDGLRGQFTVGALLGAMWVPCAGPTLGGALSLAANSTTLPAAGVIMALFSLGATLPLLLLAYGSRKALTARRASLAEIGRWGTPVLGGVLLVFGILVIVGWDRTIQAALVNAMPEWLVTVTTRF
ncbi:MAG: cytochrome c biogenesis protein CcdA [Betaproteobacteria bacterium]|nr:cytochrome c biogenesis protein CcdA [Betaproteobacteria bacterium]